MTEQRAESPVQRPDTESFILTCHLLVIAIILSDSFTIWAQFQIVVRIKKNVYKSILQTLKNTN